MKTLLRFSLTCFAIVPFVLNASCFKEKRPIKFSCRVSNYKSSGFYVTSELTASLEKLARNEVNLRKIKFSYVITEKKWDQRRSFKENEFIWAQQTLSSKQHTNKKDYKPRKYIHHNLFKNLFQPYSYGLIDFIIPHHPFRRSSFIVRIIFSNILDHWGGSIPLTCTREDTTSL